MGKFREDYVEGYIPVVYNGSSAENHNDELVFYTPRRLV